MMIRRQRQQRQPIVQYIFVPILQVLTVVLVVLLTTTNSCQKISVYGQDAAGFTKRKQQQQQQQQQQQEESLISSILSNNNNNNNNNNNADDNETKNQQTNTNNNRFKSHRWGVLLGRSNDNNNSNNDESSLKVSTRTNMGTKSTTATTDQLMNVMKQKAIKSILSNTKTIPTKTETIDDKVTTTTTTTTTNNKTTKQSVVTSSRSLPTVQLQAGKIVASTLSTNTIAGWILQRFVYNLLHPFEVPIYFQQHTVATAAASVQVQQTKSRFDVIFNTVVVEPIRNFLSINPLWLHDCIRSSTDTGSSSTTGSISSASTTILGTSSSTGNKIPFTVTTESATNKGKVQQQQKQQVHAQIPIVKQQQQQQEKQTPIILKQQQIPKLLTQQQQQQQQGKTVFSPQQSTIGTTSTGSLPKLTTTIGTVSVSNGIKQIVSNIQRLQNNIQQVLNSIPKTLLSNILLSSIVLFVYEQIKNYFVVDLLQNNISSAATTNVNIRSLQYCIHLLTYIIYIGQGIYFQNTVQKFISSGTSSNNNNFIQSAFQQIKSTIKNNDKVSNGYMILLPVVAVVVPIVISTIVQITLDILSGFLLTFSGQLLPGDTIQIPSSSQQKSIKVSIHNIEYVYDEQIIEDEKEHDSTSTDSSDVDSDSIETGDTTNPHNDEEEGKKLLLSGIVQSIGLLKSHVRVNNDSINTSSNYNDSPTTTSSRNIVEISNTILLQQVLSLQQQQRQEQKLSTSILQKQQQQQQQQNQDDEKLPVKEQSIAPNKDANESMGQQKQIIIQELYFSLDDSEKIINLCDSIIQEIRMTCPNIVIVQQETGDDEQSIQANWIDISLEYLTVLVQVQFTLIHVQEEQEQEQNTSSMKRRKINLEELQNKERVLKAINTAVRYHDMTYYNTKQQQQK